MSAPADPARQALTMATDDASARVRQASGQILRSLAGGNSWTSELMQTYRERYRKAMSDLAVARALLCELDKLDRFAAGEAPVKP